MPRIPLYEANPGYFQLAKGDVEAAGAPGRALARFGEAVDAFGGTILDVAKQRDAAEKQADLAKQAAVAAAEIERANGTAQLMARLHQSLEDIRVQTDPATWTERFPLQIGNIGQEITESIRDPAARAEVAAAQETLTPVYGAILQGDSLRRVSAQGVGSPGTELEFAL